MDRPSLRYSINQSAQVLFAWLIAIAILAACLVAPAYGQTGTSLTSGKTVFFQLPSVQGSVLYYGTAGYRIDVPPGAASLSVVVTTPNGLGRFLGLFLRFGTDISVTAAGQVVADTTTYSISTTADSLISNSVIGTSGSPRLQAGTYFIAISDDRGGPALSGTITATIAAPGANCTYGVTPSAVAVQGGGGSGNLTVTTSAPCSWAASSNSSWLTVTPSAGTGSLPVGYVAAANAGANPRTGLIAIGGQFVTVTQAGTQAVVCNYGVSPSAVEVPTAGASGTLAVTTATGCSWTATSDSSWLTIPGGASGSGNGSIRYVASANAATSARSGKITVAPGQVVTFNQIASAPPVPTIAQNGVVNGASFQAGIAAGSWVTIQGSNLSTTTRTWTASDFVDKKLPMALDGVSIQVNGKDAAVYFVSPSQINALAPLDNAAGSVSVTVKNTMGTATGSGSLQTFAPAFFVFDPEDRRYVSAVHTDGVLVGKPNLFGSGAATRLAAPGDRVLLFGTGFGPTEPMVPADEILLGAAPLVNPRALSIRIGGVPATVEFAGLSGSGLYQFNVIIPNTFGGDQSVVADIGGLSSQPNVFLTIAGNPQAAIAATPGSLSFHATIGGTAPVAQSLSLSSTIQSVDFTVAVSITSGGNWLSAAPTSGATPASMSVSANPAGLAAGTYTGSLRINASGASNSPLSVGVTLVVGAAPTITAEPGSLSFQEVQGGTAPAQQSITLSSSGVPIDFTVAGANTWVTLDRTSGTTPATVKIGVNITGMGPGDYSSNVRISVPAASNTSLTVTVTMHVSATNAPFITSVTPASLQQGNFTFNFQINGSGFAGSTVTFSQPGGISFTPNPINGFPPPTSISGPLFVEVNAVPGPRTVTVTNSFGSATATFTVQPRSGVFTISNLRAGPATISGRVYKLPVSVDFNDSSGAASSAGLSMLLVVTFPTGPISSIIEQNNAVKPGGVTTGQTQGTMTFIFDLYAVPGTTPLPPPPKGTITVNFINSRGDATNSLAGTF
jgi:uncharacterized protein (TIGR03437 family)